MRYPSGGERNSVTVINGSRDANVAKTISICETQPVTSEGLRALLASCPDLNLVASTDSLTHAIEQARYAPSDLVLVDKAFGMQAIIDWLAQLSDHTVDGQPRPVVVIWGVS